MNNAVYPVGDQLAGTIAVLLLADREPDPEPLELPDPDELGELDELGDEEDSPPQQIPLPKAIANHVRPSNADPLLSSGSSSRGATRT